MFKNEDIDSQSVLWWVYTLAACLALALMSYLMPLNSWDLLGHLGSAFALDRGETDMSLMALSYAEAALHMDKGSFDELVSGNAERLVWSSDPESFRQLLPFYAPRILVTGPAFLANEAGVSPLLTMRAMSSFWAAAALLIGAVAFKSLLPKHTWLVVPLIGLFSGLLEVARFEGADALACFTFVTFCFFYINGSRWALLLIVVMPLTRSDTVIMSCLATVVCFLTIPRARVTTVAAGLLAAVVYFSVNSYFENYGWAKQFYVVNIQYLTHPADANVTVTLGNYISALLNGLITLIYDKTFIGFLIVALLILIFATTGIIRSTAKAWLGRSDQILRIYCLSLLSTLFLILHYFAFPHVLTRYFAGEYFILLLCGLALLKLEPQGNRL
ncbi:MAG: hypothetical protein AB8B64_20295 [Granulosicoccus sp.]